MTRRAVQLALFLAAGWMLLLSTLVVMIFAVRAPHEQDWPAISWVVALSLGSLIIFGSLLYMVLFDTARGRAPVPPPPTSEEELYPSEPSSVRVLEEGELPGPAGGPSSEGDLAEIQQTEELVITSSTSSGEPEILGGGAVSPQGAKPSSTSRVGQRTPGRS